MGGIGMLMRLISVTDDLLLPPHHTLISFPSPLLLSIAVSNRHRTFTAINHDQFFAVTTGDFINIFAGFKMLLKFS
jgi:hypothetical protein